MAKRKTKEQREAEQYAALRQRVEDVCAGATYGECYLMDDYTFSATELSRIVIACQRAFICEEDGNRNDYLFKPHNLDEYESVDSITEFLFNHKVRA